MEQKDNDAIYFVAMDKVRFRKPILPGDQIALNWLPSERVGE